MPTDTRQQLIKTIRERRYLNRDFDGFRNDLLEYAKAYFPEQIQNLSPNSMGGLLLELAAYIGDVHSFYQDHQFHELSSDTATEDQSIERLLKEAGVPIMGAAPAVVSPVCLVKIPVTAGASPAVPNPSALPVIKAGTTAKANNGTLFELTEDVDFAEVNNDGSYKADIIIGSRDASDTPTSFIMSRTGVFISGQRATESFTVSGFEKFKTCTLANENVTEILSVRDASGKQYYEVGYLTQDVVYKGILNKNSDNDLVKENLEIIPAPYRFTKETNVRTNLTTLTFGGGSADTLDDDIVPDPSEFALPLYGKTTFTRFTLNPANLLKTGTLGILTPDTTITVTYRYGGGLSHNIPANTLRGVDTLRIEFPRNPTSAIASWVRDTVDVNNDSYASGGDDVKSLAELKGLIPAFKASQSRIVVREDLLARIYTLPSNFGRVFRASVRANPNNPNAAALYILCRNSNSELILAPDSLKKNLAKYLNEYRLISDAMDILDAQIINIKIEYSIVVEPTYNKQLVLQTVNSKLASYFGIKNFEIDQPLVLSDIQNVIFNNLGVVSVLGVRVESLSGTQGSNVYSNTVFNVQQNTFNGIIIPPPGAMFEVKYRGSDIVSQAI